jgi:hypothetical protein
MLTFLLLLLAFIAFLLLMFGAAIPRINLLGLGLALWVLAELLGAWPG